MLSGLETSAFLLLLTFIGGWLKQVTHRPSISTKINCGYALALGIAVLGTTGGMTIAERYEQQVRKVERNAQEEIRLLNNLETNVLQVLAQQQMMASAGELVRFQDDYSDLIQDTTEFKELWFDFKSFQSYTKNSAVEELPNDVRTAGRILEKYQGSLETYLQQIENLLKQVDANNLNPEELQAAQKLFLSFNHNEVSREIHYLSDELADLIELAYAKQEQAEAKAIAAQGLQGWIIAASMLVSLAIASLVALYTSRAIARPLRSVTDVVQQATQDADFDVQVPVTTDDEVGVLAASFNNLIQRTAACTQKLEQAQQTLESRIEEQTQDLWQQNQRLLKAYNELSQNLQTFQNAQAQLMKTEKLSILAPLATSVAHEISDPLSFMYSNLVCANSYTQDLLELVRLYQQQYPNPNPVIQEQLKAIDFDFLREDMTETLSSMEMSTERLCQLVLSLGNFSRLDEAEMKPVDVHQAMENSLLILNHQLKEIELVKHYENLPRIECYPTQLNQAFINILQNAIDALKLEAERPNKQIVIQTEKVARNQVQIRIRDNGHGIPSTIKDKIFDPFFTTKGVGKGTGLGLTTCSQIINKHNGQIQVISQLDRGTEVVISLPIQQLQCPVVTTSRQFASTELPSITVPIGLS